MHFVILALCAMLVCHTSLSMGAEKILREEKKVFGGEGCIPKASCPSVPQIPGLKEVGFWVKEREHPSTSKDNIKGNDAVLYAWYETQAQATLEDFAFVQYVRGCIFGSAENEKGEITTHFNVVRKHLGERKRYIHLDWEIDTRSTDPFYDSNPEFAVRHYFMEWNKTPERFPEGQGFFYGEDPPIRPRLSIRHTAYPFAHTSPNDKGFAINHSLEYRTCLYRTSDIPRKGSGIIPGALVCHDWKSSFVYNHKEARYVSPIGVVGACKPATIPDLKSPW